VTNLAATAKLTSPEASKNRLRLLLLLMGLLAFAFALPAFAAISVTVSPTQVALNPGAQQQFTAQVSGTTNQVVIWSISGAGCAGITCGQISAGLYTAPTTIPVPNIVTVKATSFADATQVATATVSINTPVTVSVSPTTVQVFTGGQQQFAATVKGSTDTAVTWSVSGACSGAACGTVSSAGLYAAPANVPSPATVTVTATSQADPTKSAAATVTVVSPVTVSVSPATVSLPAGVKQQFTANVTGTTNTAVTWSLSGAGCSGATCGSITSSGLYTAPATVPSPATVTVTATSQAATTQSGSAAVTVTAPIAVSVSPASPSVTISAQQQFTATVTGTTNKGVTWSLSGAGCTGAACGTISGSGLYTAPASVPTPATVTVTATSQVDSTKTGTATVTVVAPISVTVSPSSPTVATKGQQQFTATVTGTANTAVTWSVTGTNCGAAACGTITSAGLYTAPTSVPTSAAVTVTATSQADVTKSGKATVTIVAGVAVTVAPASTSVVTGAGQQFTATVVGSANTAVTWTLSGTGCSGAACGTITAAGLYTAPAAIPNPPTVTVTATSQADTSKSGKATVTVVAPVAVAVSPTSANVVTGAQQQFTATVTGTANTAVTWTLSGAGCSGSACGTVTATGLYTAPAIIPNPATVTVTATSQADQTKSGKATVTVIPPVAVSVSPATVSVTTGTQQQFTATVTGTANSAVTWSVSGAGCSGGACGTISASGLYTAPAAVPTPSTVTVTATSQADVTKNGKATVTVIPPVVVTLSPTSPKVIAGAQQKFTATVTGTTNTAVTWTISGAGCSGATCGAITTAGLYTAPTTVPTPPTVTVTATSQADATKSASATVTIVPPTFVAVFPGTAAISVGGSLQFTARVSGTANTGVKWTLTGAGCSGVACGTISSTGLYTAPAAVPIVATIQVIATSASNANKSASATVTITASANAKFSGSFAFLFHGFDSAGIYAMAGSFTADGNGNLSGVEDVNRVSGVLSNQAITGTYNIGPDNRGTFTIDNGSATSTFAFALSADGKSARFIEFDSSGVRGSGVLKAQNTSAFSRGALIGSYVSVLSGADSTGGRFGALALLFYNGLGSITGSTWDVNDNGTAPPPFAGFPGTYTVLSNGRGSEILFIQGFDGATFHLTLYVVSSQEVFVISSDALSAGHPIFSGVALLQSGAPFAGSSFDGPSVFAETGLNNGSTDVSVGDMVFDGNQTLAGQFAENDGGAITSAGALSGVYSVGNTGRMTFNLTNSQTLANTSGVGYAVAPNYAFILDSSPAVRMGRIEPQTLTAPFASTDVAGPFIFGPGEMAKENAELATGADLFDGTKTVGGTEDLSQTSGLTPAAALAGSYSISAAANNGSGTITLTSPGAQSLAIWIVSFTEFVGVDIDPANTSPTIVRFEQ